ncbi:MAG: T9SS type A sorting domain-containing protein [Saprospiraceae bacterium]
MKNTLLWSLFLFSSYLLSAQTFDYQKIRKSQPDRVELRSGETFIVDSVLCFRYNEVLDGVVPELREYVLEINDQGEVTRKVVEYWDVAANQYLEREQVLRTFAGNGELIELVTQTVSDGSDNFINLNRTRFMRNAAGNPEEIVHEVWDNNWQLESRELYEYEAGDRPSLFTFQMYENGAWQNQFQSFTNYNSDNKIASTLFQTWDNGVWQNGNRTFLSYDENGALILTNREVWNVSAGDWQLSSRQIQVYQFGINTEIRDELYQDFSDSWIPQQRELRFYDEAGNLFQSTKQTYLNEAWLNVFNNISIYDENGNLTRLIGQLWVEEDWRTQNTCDFYYSLFVTNVRNILQEQISCTYANPFKTGNAFNCAGLAEMQTAQLSIYNTQGQQVYYQNITYTDNFLINKKMPIGLYQIVIQTERGIVFSEKLFIMD